MKPLSALTPTSCGGAAWMSDQNTTWDYKESFVFWTKLLTLHSLSHPLTSKALCYKQHAIPWFCCVRPKRVRTSVPLVPQIARGQIQRKAEGSCSTWSWNWKPMQGWEAACKLHEPAGQNKNTTAASAGGLGLVFRTTRAQRSKALTLLLFLRVHHTMWPKLKNEY